MKILVTGATGFIGSHLVERLLSCGYDVRVLVRPNIQRRNAPSWLFKSDVEVLNGDVTKPSTMDIAVKGADIVFHLAAMLGNRPNADRLCFHVNKFGTQVVVESSAEAGVRRIVHLSTTGVMGRLKTLPGNVDQPYNPENAYEKSKCEAEHVVLKYVKEERISATIIRPAHVYGPKDYNTLQLYSLMKKLRVLVLPDGGRNLFQPIYVTDLVDALVLCIERENASKNKIYIAAGNDVVTFRDFLELSAEAMEMDVKILGMPSGVMREFGTSSERVAKFLSLSPVLSRSRIEFFCRNHVYNTRPLLDDLKWFPKTTLKEGLTKAVEWYRRKNLL